MALVEGLPDEEARASDFSVQTRCWYCSFPEMSSRGSPPEVRTTKTPSVSVLWAAMEWGRDFPSRVIWWSRTSGDSGRLRSEVEEGGDCAGLGRFTIAAGSRWCGYGFRFCSVFFCGWRRWIFRMG